MAEPLGDVLTPEEVAVRWRCSRYTVMDLVRAGVLARLPVRFVRDTRCFEDGADHRVERAPGRRE